MQYILSRILRLTGEMSSMSYSLCAKRLTNMGMTRMRSAAVVLMLSLTLSEKRDLGAIWACTCSTSISSYQAMLTRRQLQGPSLTCSMDTVETDWMDIEKLRSFISHIHFNISVMLRSLQKYKFVSQIKRSNDKVSVGCWQLSVQLFSSEKAFNV